ncbi:MAG TPA: sigma-70 family RNA polymerase sigma factor [Acidimicrobiales bacterium]|nr:sigma-70 family RNA polymerase sigma factor [Acidimicrobiales bacterium]
MRHSDLRETSDAALVVAVGRCNNDALAELFRRHSGAVLALVRRVLKDDARAAEVVQEVFLGLWNTPERFDPEAGSLRSFLLAGAHGRAVGALRQSSDVDYDVEREVRGVIVAEHVRDAVAALSAQERRVIELAYFGGQTYREVALLLDEPEATIKTLIKTGMARLAQRLATAGYASQ